MGQDDIDVGQGVVIPRRELEITAVRSSGPGGQNVNKVASKVDLRFDFRASAALPADVKARLATLAQNKVDADGRIRITSELTRDQSRNIADACTKLAVLVRAALVHPKTRRKTRPSRAARRRRLDAKRHQADKKRARRESFE